MELHIPSNEEIYRNSYPQQIEYSDNLSEVTSIRNPKKAGKWTVEEVYNIFYTTIGCRVKKTCI